MNLFEIITSDRWLIFLAAGIYGLTYLAAYGAALFHRDDRRRAEAAALLSQHPLAGPLWFRRRRRLNRAGRVSGSGQCRLPDRAADSARAAHCVRGPKQIPDSRLHKSTEEEMDT
ncbi:hypothetical protein ACWEPC_10770 [Nonomuraea sp. NPDC004297]